MGVQLPDKNQRCCLGWVLVSEPENTVVRIIDESETLLPALLAGLSVRKDKLDQNERSSPRPLEFQAYLLEGMLTLNRIAEATMPSAAKLNMGIVASLLEPRVPRYGKLSLNGRHEEVPVPTRASTVILDTLNMEQREAVESFVHIFHRKVREPTVLEADTLSFLQG
jgi:hypothetical protein